MAALTANGFIAICKFGGWALTGASSMLAEAVHSVADCGNQALLLLGGRRAKREADDQHPFGYGRERYVFAFMVAIILFSLGGLFALYEGWHKLQEVINPEPGHDGESLLTSPWWWVPVVILSAAIVAESLSFRTAIIESNQVRGKQSWWRFIRTARAPELPVILLEDLGALLGLVFALGGVGLSLLTQNLIFDAIGTGMIGLLLVAIAVVLAWETKSLLLGEGATKKSVGRISAAILGSEGVEQLIHMKTLHLGPEEVLVAAKIAVDRTDDAAEVAEIIDRTEVAIRAAEPMVTALYLEPDIYRENHTPASSPAELAEQATKENDG